MNSISELIIISTSDRGLAWGIPLTIYIYIYIYIYIHIYNILLSLNRNFVALGEELLDLAYVHEKQSSLPCKETSVVLITTPAYLSYGTLEFVICKLSECAKMRSWGVLWQQLVECYGNMHVT